MKKPVSNLVLGLFIAALSPALAQQKVQPCDTYAAMEERFKADPQAKSIYESVQAILQQQLKENAQQKSSAFEYTVPVVFHVLHTGGSENVSDASMIAALDWVNKDFAALHPDASTVASPFQPLYIDSDIKFMLAHKDPSGNPTTGITHRYDTRTMWDRSGNLTALYSGITWDPKKYLNIIVVKEILAQPGQQGIVVGYTYKPGTWSTSANQDCIVYRHDFFNAANARNLTHEIGHWLNLAHTFGNTNNPGVTCGDDGLGDTPPTKGSFAICPSSLSGNSCPGSGGLTNVENFMDYSSCPKNFTQDQTTAMRNALASNVSGRSNLWQTSNLIATDVDGTAPCCPPIADFLSSNNAYTVCAGGSLQLKDYSYNGQAISFNWNADQGAVVSSPNSANTSVMFTTVGQTNVTLTVSNSQGTSSKVRTVHVLDATAGIVGPHFEGFEQLGLPPDWKSENADVTSPGWEVQFPSYAYEGIGAYFIDSYNQGPNQVDVLETPIMDMANSPVKRFEFALAYAKRSSTHNSQLKVTASTDCGGSWIDVLTLGANQLMNGSGGINPDPFSPTTADEWNYFDLSTYPGAATAWNLLKNSPNLIIRFTFTEITGFGNNIYIDAINLPGSTNGLSELGLRSAMNLYPNPTNGNAKLRFNLNDASAVTVSVLNVLGAEVMSTTEGQRAAGEHEVDINAGTLDPGVYFVKLGINGQSATARMIVE